MQKISLANQSSVLEIGGKLVYNRARIMKHAQAMVKNGIELDMSSALRHAWQDAHKTMDRFQMQIENKSWIDAYNKSEQRGAFVEGDFSDRYKAKFYTIRTT